MQGDRSAATAMLGLPGFILLAVSELDGELEQAVETIAGEESAGAAACRRCRTVLGGRPRPCRRHPAAAIG